MKKIIYAFVIIAALLGGYLTANTYAQPVEIIKIADNGGGGGGSGNTATCYSTYTTPLLGGGTMIFVCGICTQTKAKTFSDSGTCYF